MFPSFPVVLVPLSDIFTFLFFLVFIRFLPFLTDIPTDLFLLLFRSRPRRVIRFFSSTTNPGNNMEENEINKHVNLHLQPDQYIYI